MNNIRLFFAGACIFLLSACATIKPNNYDAATNRFDNYKDNYSMVLLDGYVLSKNEKEISFVSSSSTTFVNETDETDFHLGVFGDAARSVRKSQISKTLSFVERSAKGQFGSCEGCEVNKIRREDEGVTIEIHQHPNATPNRKQYLRILVKPLSKGSSNYILFMSGISSRAVKFDQAITDLKTMMKTFEMPAFDEDQRKEEKK